MPENDPDRNRRVLLIHAALQRYREEQGDPPPAPVGLIVANQLRDITAAWNKARSGAKAGKPGDPPPQQRPWWQRWWTWLASTLVRRGGPAGDSSSASKRTA